MDLGSWVLGPGYWIYFPYYLCVCVCVSYGTGAPHCLPIGDGTISLEDGQKRKYVKRVFFFPMVKRNNKKR